MRKLKILAVVAMLFLAATAHAAPSYYDGTFTNVLLKGYLSGQKGATLDNLTTSYLKATLPAAGVFQIVTGNFKVGAGTPTVSLNGEDAYVTGTFEVDGAVRFDNATLTLRGIAYTLPAADGAASQYLQTSGAGVLSWAAGTSGTLDEAYNAGITITADAGAVAITNNAANNTGNLSLTKSPVGAQSGDIFTITGGAQGSGDMIQFVTTGSGNDLAGSGATWSVTKAGAATFASGAFTSVTTTNWYQSVIASAASGNTALTVDAAGNGTITIGGVSTGNTIFQGVVAFNGNATIGNAATDTLTSTSIVNSNVTLDDGATDSPSLIFKDATDETATLKKTDAANLDLTTSATEGLRIMVGNLRVGDGAPGTAAMDGEDFYVNGDSEFDGTVTFDGAVTLNSTTVTLRANEAITFTHASDGAADDLTIALTGANDASIILTSAGTGEDAISLLSGAGGVNIDAASGKDVDISGGQVLISSKTTGASAIALTTNQGAAETIVVTNTQGTGEDAITLTSTAGGVDINAAATKNITLDGGQILLTGTQDVASAIGLATNTGTSETITIINTAGTGESAVTITSTAGGVNIDAAAAKDVDISGGQVLISSKTTGASAIALTTNQGAAETIVVTNTQGTGAGAITLTATAGGITLNAGLGGITTGDAITGDGTAAMGGFLKTVTDDTNGKTLDINESGTVQTNAGAVGAAAWTLPGAAAGLNYCFVVMAAQELRVTPAAGDVINIAGIAAEAAEYWTANAAGESLCIVAVDATNWVAISFTGTWTQQTP